MRDKTTILASLALLAIVTIIMVFPVISAMVRYGTLNVYDAYMKDKCIEVKDPQGIWYACNFTKLPGTYQSYIEVKEKK